MNEAPERARPQGLLVANLLVASGTLLSRITGLARVVALGYALGYDRLSDAYNLANNTPNIIYELLLGGILTASLVPLFVDYSDRKDDRAISAVVSVTMIALAVITVVAVVAAPLIIRLYSASAKGDDVEAYRSVATTLSYWFMPQIFFYGCTALFAALLNARKRFTAFAFAPVLNNVVVIVALLSVGTITRHPTLATAERDRGLVTLLGVGTTLGIVAMTAAMLPALRRAGVRLRWNPEFRHPAVRRLVTLSGWAVGYVVANQIALAIVANLAQRRPADYSAYVAAFQFFQLPHGLLAVSIMTTFAPDLARAANHRDVNEFRRRTSLGLRLTVLLVLPAAVGYVTLAHPLVTVLLKHGNLDAGDAIVAARVLAGFALGLVSFSAYLYLLRAFYARSDTRTPFVLNVIENGINLVLAAILYDRYGVQGLAWSFAAAYAIAAVIAFAVLGRRMGGFPVRATLWGLWRPLIASVVMGEVVWLATRAIGSDDSTAGAFARLSAGTVLGVVLYLGLLTFQGAPELHYLRALVDRVRGRRGRRTS